MKCSIEVSKGNLKLGNDTLIINMNSATDCPSAALGLCKLGNRCYALKAEKLYPTVLPYRRRQANYWKSHSALEIANDIMGIISRGRTVIHYVRLSEAGDFETQADVEKAELIAMHLKKVAVQVYCYSARSDLDFSGCVSLLVKGSSHDKGNNGRTIARRRNIVGDGMQYSEAGVEYAVCPGNCRICNLCKEDNRVNVVFPLH